MLRDAGDTDQAVPGFVDPVGVLEQQFNDLNRPRPYRLRLAKKQAFKEAIDQLRRNPARTSDAEV